MWSETFGSRVVNRNKGELRKCRKEKVAIIEARDYKSMNWGFG